MLLMRIRLRLRLAVELASGESERHGEEDEAHEPKVQTYLFEDK
jgi:hypothetical protein